MDSDCPCPLAVIGRAALPPGLAERLRQAERGELDAAAVEAELAALAGIVQPRRGG